MSELEKAIQECGKHGDDRKEISMVYMNNKNLKTILAAAKMLPEMVEALERAALILPPHYGNEDRCSYQVDQAIKLAQELLK